MEPMPARTVSRVPMSCVSIVSSVVVKPLAMATRPPRVPLVVPLMVEVAFFRDLARDFRLDATTASTLAAADPVAARAPAAEGSDVRVMFLRSRDVVLWTRGS